VIIPVYNAEEYLRYCIDSIVNQTYRNIEIILINDGSTDTSPEICEKYAALDERIKVISKENGGPSDARNVGLNAAKGEYICFCDSDDYFTVTDVIELLVTEAADGDFDFLFYDADIMFEDGHKVKKNFRIRKKPYENSTGPEIMSKLINNNEFSHSVWLLFVRRDTLEAIGLTFSSGLFVAEDAIFTVNLFLHSKSVRHVAKTLYCRRIRGDSITTVKSNVNHFVGYYTAFLEFTGHLSSDDIDSLQRKLLVNRSGEVFKQAIAHYYRMNRADRASVSDRKKEVLQKAREMNCFENRNVRLICQSPFIYIHIRKPLRKLRQKIIASVR
jgi:glycosyltransferase involved in cell wall biosynthesis